MINYWTLHAFGASRMLLRLPSLLSGCLLLVAFLRLANRQGFGLWWTLLLLFSLLDLHALMYYAGEARSYMPLAAAVAGTFACYLQPRETRGGLDRAIGAIAIVVGVLFHPYFPLYWMALAFFTLARQPGVAHADRKARLYAFIRHCEPWVAFPAAAGYFILAGHTWLLGGPETKFDPFEIYALRDLLDYFFCLGHFEFLGGWWFGAPAIMLLAGALLCRRSCWRDEPVRQRAITAWLLIVTALALSFVISCISYFSSYWLLPRQWVASDALACFGFVWLLRECVVLLRENHRRLGLALTAVFALLLLSNSIPPIQKRIYAHSEQATAVKVRDHGVGTQSVPSVHPVSDADWVALANANLDAGGPVWPIFREFYVSYYDKYVGNDRKK